MLDQARDTAKDIAGSLLKGRSIEELPIEIGYEGNDIPAATIENKGGAEVLLLNLDKVGDEQEDTILSATSTQVWDEQGGFFDPHTSGDVHLVKDGLSKGEVQSIANYFDQYISDRDVELLRRSLYLRLEWEDDRTYTDLRQMTDRKGDLRKEYGEKATVVANLSSSGYYDDGGYMREIFTKIDSSTHLSPGDYQRIYDLVLNDEPFCVFISGWDRIPAIKSEIISKLTATESYPIQIDFVDVRAQGGENRAKLERAILELQRDAKRMHFEARIEPRETAYRIYPEDYET